MWSNIKSALLLLFVAMALFSECQQKESPKVAYTSNDSENKFSIIPKDVLSKKHAFLVIEDHSGTVEIAEKSGFEIGWFSPKTDGSYYLTITPKQIYLRSGHNNPNPNSLYWITDIDTEQFKLIKNFLLESDTAMFDNYTNKHSSMYYFSYKNFELEEFINDAWTNKRYDNFHKLLTLINTTLSKQNRSLKIPPRKEFENVTPLWIFSHAEDAELYLVTD